MSDPVQRPRGGQPPPASPRPIRPSKVDFGDCLSAAKTGMLATLLILRGTGTADAASQGAGIARLYSKLTEGVNVEGLSLLQTFVAKLPQPPQEVVATVAQALDIGPDAEAALVRMGNEFVAGFYVSPAPERSEFAATSVALYGEDGSTRSVAVGNEQLEASHWTARMARWTSRDKMLLFVLLSAKQRVEPINRLEVAALDALRLAITGDVKAAEPLIAQFARTHPPGLQFVLPLTGACVEDREYVADALSAPGPEKTSIIQLSRELFGSDASNSA